MEIGHVLGLVVSAVIMMTNAYALEQLHLQERQDEVQNQGSFWTLSLTAFLAWFALVVLGGSLDIGLVGILVCVCPTLASGVQTWKILRLAMSPVD